MLEPDSQGRTWTTGAASRGAGHRAAHNVVSLTPWRQAAAAGEEEAAAGAVAPAMARSEKAGMQCENGSRSTFAPLACIG